MGEVRSQEGERPRRPSRHQFAKALAVGLGFGLLQAVLPPVGELFLSVGLQLLVLGLFLAALSGLRRRPLVLLALASYSVVLVVATAMPFGFLDGRVLLEDAEISVATLPAVLESAGYSVRVRSELPSGTLQLQRSRPTLRELDAALRDQFGYRLHRPPTCGNAVSVSWLWGPRTGSKSLWLGRR